MMNLKSSLVNRIVVTLITLIVVDLVFQQQVILKSEVFEIVYCESFSSSKAPHQQLVNDLKIGKRHQQKLSLSLSRTAPAPSTKGQIRIGLRMTN